jgi:hypothetical protein
MVYLFWRRVYAVTYRTYAVALSNAVEPTAAWYFIISAIFRFFARRAKKRNIERRVKYRCEQQVVVTAEVL